MSRHESAVGRMGQSLRVRNYRLLAGGQLTSEAGNWMQRVAQDWLVLELTRSGAAMALTATLQLLPTLLFGAWGGVLADRYPKRRLLVLSQLAAALPAVLLGLLVLGGNVQVWQVYGLAVVLGLVNVVYEPTKQSFIAETVDSGRLPNAVGFSAAAGNIARIVGCAAGGALIVAAGTGWVFIVNALSYLALVAGLLRMRNGELHPSPRSDRLRGQLREGVRHVAARPDLALPLVLLFLVGLVGLNFQLVNALVAGEVFGTGAASYGLLSAAMVAGCLLGALAFAGHVRRPPRALPAAALAFAAMQLLLAAAPTYLAFLVLLVPLGFAQQTFVTATNATVQLGARPEMRGRVMGVHTMVFMGSIALGALAVGWLTEVLSVRWTLVLGGVMTMAATATVVLTRSRTVRNRRFGYLSTA